MRVLMTTDTMGGVWNFTRELSSGLLESGCDVALVSLGRAPSGSQQAWCDGMERAWGGRFQYAADETPLEWMEDNSHAYDGAADSLLRLAREFGADVFHTSQFCVGALPLTTPKIVTAHSDVLSWAQECRGGVPAGFDDAWLRRYRGLVSEGLAEADDVIAPTQWMLDALEANFELSSRRHVIANGRRSEPKDGVERKLQCITAGRLWDEAKNVALLKYVTSPMPILIAGEGKGEAGERLGDAVMLGALAEDEMLEVFRQSSVYICTSRYEPFGLAPLEAAQCGCAVVANDIPSLREVWGDAALYFSGSEALSAILQRLTAQPALLEAARMRSFERAREFSRERMTEQYLEVFQGALARGANNADAA